MKAVHVAARQPVSPVENKFTARQPVITAKNKAQLQHFTSLPCVLSMNAYPLSRTSARPGAKPAFGLPYLPVLKSQQPFHVCLAGGKGMMENNEGSRWTSPENEMEKFKGQSIEDMLRQQIHKQKNGGGGSKPPGGRGGGGGGPSGSDEGDFAGMSDETQQIILATIGFLFVYISVINGVELAKLSRDFCRYLLSGTESVRLKRAKYKWARFCKILVGSKKVLENGMEEAPAQRNNLDYYRDDLRNYMKPSSDE